MTTITIGEAYFEALLRRADFHTTGHSLPSHAELGSSVTISKVEHESLLQVAREHNLLKKALFRGGLTQEALDILLQGEGEIVDSSCQYKLWSEDTFTQSSPSAVAMSIPFNNETSPFSDYTVVCNGSKSGRQPFASPRVLSFSEPDSSLDSFIKDDEGYHQIPISLIPVHDQRTLLISNLSERTTHKDLAGIVRGGRLLDIFIRNDRSATISFVEGAAEFLAYAKRNDIYLGARRLEIRWGDRQFHVPPYISSQITKGATRNLVVRNIAEKISADQIRDHLDHIHNLVVLDIHFKDGDAFISTNSIHNALYARTCMTSRTAYKGARVEHYPDECAIPLPKPDTKARVPAPCATTKPVLFSNPYALLQMDFERDSDSDDDTSSIVART